jgi:AAA15 family ATPase/GTPase
MLENIHIQNFRCFKDFRAKGFERINLIGGKNNSGKTCFLEGILALRKNKNKGNQLYDIANELRNERIEDLIFEDLKIGKEIKGTITISGNQFTDDTDPQYSYSTDVEKNFDTAWLKSDLEIFYISQTKSFPNIDFFNTFYRIEVEDKTDEFVKILNKIDSSITKIRTIGSDGNMPKIKQVHNRNLLKLSSYGDATKSVLRYFTPIIERVVFEGLITQEYVLLIDEIENGLHYTVHEDFWNNIFTLSKELNIQIFATTHSLEMITAFDKVAIEQNEGAYFEMIRHQNKITAFKRDAEQLEYVLENEKSFRGE